MGSHVYLPIRCLGHHGCTTSLNRPKFAKPYRWKGKQKRRTRLGPHVTTAAKSRVRCIAPDISGMTQRPYRRRKRTSRRLQHSVPAAMDTWQKQRTKHQPWHLTPPFPDDCAICHLSSTHHPRCRDAYSLVLHCIFYSVLLASCLVLSSILAPRPCQLLPS
ncbi:hypothetical protein B0T25DRAFT_124876 [Lasiosphaeria hispida]|uniref:Uncharacterized protein n=1 Tax=Lasiosphaeria hispida TaxID=260671 RepID=A0AAJ0HS97_9PEZI|nr:hypothetical protein B0T25DRAFT_124876 [Lasiosphaeria hispida]